MVWHTTCKGMGGEEEKNIQSAERNQPAMTSQNFQVRCSECHLRWQTSLLNVQPGRPLACPICGNQHFSLPELETHAEKAPVSLETGAEKSAIHSGISSQTA